MKGKTKILEQGTLLGSYRIVRFLGSGGMGSVYEAEHVALGVRRAVKVFSAGSRPDHAMHSRFLSEGRTLANIDHPRIVRVHDLAVDEAAGATYFAMDLVLSPEGTPRSLEDERLSGLDEERIAGFFCDICEGLDYIHSKGIAHGDVKLENILVGQDGRAVVSDFGISRIFDDGLRAKVVVGETAAESSPRTCMGTCRYMAPEMANAHSSVATPETDAWALGVCLFRMLTGLWLDDVRRKEYLAILVGYELPWKDAVVRLCSFDPAARRIGGGLSALAQRVRISRVRRIHRRRIIATGAVLSSLFVACGAVFAWRHLSNCRPGGFAKRDAGGASQDSSNASQEKHGTAHFREVRLCADAPGFGEFRRRIDDASREILLKNLHGFGDDFNEVMRQFIDCQASYYCYDIYWPRDRIERFDAVVAARMDPALPVRSAETPQLLVLAGEIYRQKKLLAFDLGDYPEDVDRIAELAKRFVGNVAEGRYDPEWAFEILEASVPFERLDGRGIVPADVRSRRSLDPWLSKMLQASILAAEAARAHSSAVSAQDRREHAEKSVRAARLFKEALVIHPERYRAAQRLISLAHDDPDEARCAFERCQACCFDDLRAWSAYAMTLLQLADPRRERLARFLDLAFETRRYDTLVPAFYVIGRWMILSRYDGDGNTLDDRDWSFADDNVRSKTLEVLRHYKNGETLNAAPEPCRLALSAIFAASALACGDEELASGFVRSIPDAKRNAVLGMAMRTSSPTFRKLKNMVK